MNIARLSDATVEMIDRRAPWNNEITKSYKVVNCPHCDAAVYIAAATFKSQLSRRMHRHLSECESNPYSVPPLRRCRDTRGRKPFGRETRHQSQLFIGTNGELAKHELGSLLRCVAVSKRALDNVPLRPGKLSTGNEWTSL